MPVRPVVRSQIAGIPVTRIAEQFGTPTFVYDASIIIQRIIDLGMFDYVRYAQKACSNLSIVNLARKRGTLVDAVSACEIRRALEAGFTVEGSPPPIVYTADIFDREALDLCVHLGVHVNCGSIDMIHQIGSRTPGRDITLRINPGFGHGHSQKTNTGGPQSKHGIWHEQLSDAVHAAAEYEMTVVGLHMHIGSGCDMEHLAQVCGAMERSTQVVGPSVTTISAGGGLPIPYADDEEYVDLNAYYQLWDATRNRLQAEFGHPITLEIEPGRYLAAESGYLIAEIRAVKRQAGNCFYLLDAGFNNLIRPSMYGSYQPMSITPRDGSTEPRELQDVIVGGPLCESGDIFSQSEGGFVTSRRLPVAEVGDYLIIECAGAYGSVMGSNYNSKTMAPELLITDDGRLHEIRRRQTFEDMIAAETIVG